MQARASSPFASTEDREVDRLEAAVVRTFSGAGCQSTHHIHLSPQVDVVPAFDMGTPTVTFPCESILTFMKMLNVVEI